MGAIKELLLNNIPFWMSIEEIGVNSQKSTVITLDQPKKRSILKRHERTRLINR